MNRRGVTLIEILSAMTIFALGVVAILSLWSFALRQVQNAHEVTVATEVARADLEKLKAMTWTNFPIPTSYTVGTTTERGKSELTLSWTTSATYYDSTGALLTSTQPTSLRRFKLERRVYAIDVLPKSTGGYAFATDSEVRVRSVITHVPTADDLVVVSTIMVRGGV